MTPHTLPHDWLLARASGLLAYVLVSLAVVAGLSLRTRLLGRLAAPAVVTAVHRTLSLLGLLAVGAHGVLLALDTKVDVPWRALVVPGASGYRPLAVGLGVAWGHFATLALAIAAFDLFSGIVFLAYLTRIRGGTR